MPLFTKGIELYLEMREKNRLRAEGIVTSLDRSRKEAQEQGRKEGVEQGRKEGRERARKEGLEQGRKEGREEMETEIRNRLHQRGLDLDELLRTNDGDETANPLPRRCAPASSRIYSIHIHIPGVPIPNHDPTAGRQ